jgi:GTPase SAR1 family protein
MTVDPQSTQRSVNAEATNGAGTVPQQVVAQPRVALIGRAGAGKTALARALFGARQPATAPGDIAHYQDDATPVIVDDLPGWVNGSESSLSALFSYLQSTSSASAPLVAIWYALDAASARVTDYELQLIRRFAQLYPVVLVLTRTDLVADEALGAMRSAIDEAMIPNCLGVVPVAADPLPALGVAPYGTDQVVALTSQFAEESRKDLSEHEEVAAEKNTQPDEQPEAPQEPDYTRLSHLPTANQRARAHDERTYEALHDETDYSSAATGAKPSLALIALLVVVILAFALLLGRRRRNSASSQA